MEWDDLLKRDPLLHAIVLHPYVATNDDELSLRQGERVAVFSQDSDETGDDGWWLGRIDKRVGLFPLNYVEAEQPQQADEGLGGDASQSTSAKPGGLMEIPYSNIKMQQCIGAGGFGRVFRANLGRQEVAVKVLSVAGLEARELESKTQELFAEADLLACCAHVNITRLLGVVSQAPNFCLVMEYARGGSLASALRDVTLDPPVILDWATQIARGMNYLHNESPVSVVHRDLKSSNILLAHADEDGGIVAYGNVLRITDFGLAKRFTKTTHVTTAGTFAWMAPEVIRSSTFSRASDVWSFGVVLWELLTSQVPYEGIHMMTVAYSVAVEGSTLPIPSDCPAPFGDLIRGCWHRDPHQRPNFTDIVHTLQRGAQEPFVTTTTQRWSQIQDTWRVEMAGKFRELMDSQKNIGTQRAALEAAQQAQQEHERVLDERERELARREEELQCRELLLRLGSAHERPVPVKRARRGKVTKKHIGTPDTSSFRHVVHLSRSTEHPTRLSTVLSDTVPPLLPQTSNPFAPRATGSFTKMAASARPQAQPQKSPSAAPLPPSPRMQCKRCDCVYDASQQCPTCSPAIPGVRAVPVAAGPSTGAHSVPVVGASRAAARGSLGVVAPAPFAAAAAASTDSGVRRASPQTTGRSSSPLHDVPVPIRGGTVPLADPFARVTPPQRASPSPLRMDGNLLTHPSNPFSSVTDDAAGNWTRASTASPITPKPVHPDTFTRATTEPALSPATAMTSGTRRSTPHLSPRGSAPTVTTSTTPTSPHPATSASASTAGKRSPQQPHAPRPHVQAWGDSPGISPVASPPPDVVALARVGDVFLGAAHDAPRTRALSASVAEGSPAKPRPVSALPLSPPPAQQPQQQQQSSRKLFTRRSTIASIGEPYNVQHLTHVDANELTLRRDHMPPWLQPELSRDGARDYLRGKPPGTFVIRVSRSVPGSLALCVVQPPQLLWNGMIFLTPTGWQLGTEGRARFTSIAQLVAHFAVIPYAAATDGTPCTLRVEPAPMSADSRQRASSETLTSEVKRTPELLPGDRRSWNLGAMPDLTIGARGGRAGTGAPTAPSLTLAATHALRLTEDHDA